MRHNNLCYQHRYLCTHRRNSSAHRSKMRDQRDIAAYIHHCANAYRDREQLVAIGWQKILPPEHVSHRNDGDDNRQNAHQTPTGSELIPQEHRGELWRDRDDPEHERERHRKHRSYRPL